MSTGILINLCACGRPLAASQRIDKVEIKVTSEKAMLRDEPFAIMPGTARRSGERDTDMAPIKHSNGVLEEGPKFRVARDLP